MNASQKCVTCGVQAGLLLALVLISGCQDDFPTVPSQPAAQPGGAVLSLDPSIPPPPGTMTGTILGGDSMYGWGPATMDGGFGEPTYVEIRIEGFVERWTSGPPIWTTSTYVTDVDPAGTGSNCSAAARVQFWADGKAAGGYAPCDPYSTIPLQEVWIRNTVVNGTGEVSRRSGPTTAFGNCNQPGTAPCYVHHGSQRETVTPISATLSVAASRTSIIEGDTVVCTASVSGSTSWQVREWIWQPDVVQDSQPPLIAMRSPEAAARLQQSAATPTGASFSLSADGRTNTRYIGETGTMYVRAKVGTRVEQANVRVIVTPDTLKLVADPTDVVRGELVNFVSTTALGTGYEVLSWSWRPVEAHDSIPVCSAPDKGCDASVFTSGTMVINARFAGGRETEATAAIVVDPDEFAVKVRCPSNILRGAEGTCTATVTPVSARVILWEFLPDPVIIHPKMGPVDMADPVPRAGDLRYWTGVLVMSGTVRVTATYNGQDKSASTVIQVNPRSWATEIRWAGRLDDITDWPLYLDRDLLYGAHVNVSTGSVLAEFDGMNAAANREIVSDEPNKGYEFIKAHPIAIHNGYRLNSFLMDYNTVRDILVEESLRNRWEALQSMGWGNPMEIIEGVRAHETYGRPGTRGHQGESEKAVSGERCGNVARRLERIAGKPTAVVRELSAAERVALEFLDILTGHHQVHSNLPEPGAPHVLRTSDDPSPVLDRYVDYQRPLHRTIGHEGRERCEYEEFRL